MEALTADQRQTEANRVLIIRLSGILAGDTPISEGESFIAPDVDMHMSGMDFKGIDTWKTWLRFIRSRSRVTDLNLIEREVTAENGLVRLCGRWQGYVNGRLETSEVGCASYRIVDGKIVEIWTTRTNYPFMLGGLMKSDAGMLLVLAYLFFWSTFYKPRVNWEDRLPARRQSAFTAVAA